MGIVVWLLVLEVEQMKGPDDIPGFSLVLFPPFSCTNCFVSLYMWSFRNLCFFCSNIRSNIRCLILKPEPQFYQPRWSRGSTSQIVFPVSFSAYLGAWTTTTERLPDRRTTRGVTATPRDTTQGVSLHSKRGPVGVRESTPPWRAWPLFPFPVFTTT